MEMLLLEDGMVNLNSKIFAAQMWTSKIINNLS
jgi:hypothetical protein